MKKALVIVDVQNDFMPTGPLPVPEADKVAPKINSLMPVFDLVVATKDWHPANHGSFACNHPGRNPGDLIDLDGLDQVLWPKHCVKDTKGADFPKTLNVAGINKVVEKGVDANVDSYSGFNDNGHRHATELERCLKASRVDQVYLAGVATDYCVKFTALDAVEAGFDTYLVEDACRGVDIHPGDTGKAVKEMIAHNVKLTKTAELLKKRGE